MNVLFRRRKLGNGSCRGIAAASTTGLTMLRNDAPFPAGVEYVFRWGCTSNVPENAKVVNSAKAIHWCSNKRQGRLDMQAAGVNVPQTWASEAFRLETTWSSRNVPLSDQFVARPAAHAQGRQLNVGNFDTLQVYPGGYVSRLINKVAEYRVMVICNRVAWVAKKTPGNPEDVAWNVARGGRFDNVRWGDWPMAAVKEALAAAKVSGADFCGVDVMMDAEGKAYVLEVNSAPSQTSEYRQKCVAKCFDYIVGHGKDHFPDINWSPRTSWKSTIHPSLKAE